MIIKKINENWVNNNNKKNVNKQHSRKRKLTKNKIWFDADTQTNLWSLYIYNIHIHNGLSFTPILFYAQQHCRISIHEPNEEKIQKKSLKIDNVKRRRSRKKKMTKNLFLFNNMYMFDVSFGVNHQNKKKMSDTRALSIMFGHIW